MKVGQIVTFTLPSSKKKTAGKILEVRDKSVLVQTKDSKKLIPKNFLKVGKEKKKMPEKKVEPPKKEPPKAKAKKTYLVKVDGEKDRKLTLSLVKQFINKRFGKKLTPAQEKKINYMANVTIPKGKNKKEGHFIIDGELIYTSNSGVSEINNQIVGKVDMSEKRKTTLSEEQKKDKQLQKEKKEKEEEQKVKEHNDKYGKMEDLEDLWKKLKDLKWSPSDRREIEDYINDPNTYGPAYNSMNESPHDVKAEVIQKGKRPVKNVLRVYYSLLTSTTARPGKFKKEDFEFPEEEKKEPPKAKKKQSKGKQKDNDSDKQIKFLRELRARGLSQAEIMKELEKKFG